MKVLVTTEYRTSFHQQVSDILKSNYQPHVGNPYHMILNSSQYQFVEIEHPGFKKCNVAYRYSVAIFGRVSRAKRTWCMQNVMTLWCFGNASRHRKTCDYSIYGHLTVFKDDLSELVEILLDQISYWVQRLMKILNSFLETSQRATRPNEDIWVVF